MRRRVRAVSPLALTLVAWGLRLVALESAPPGWRDDELIHIHTLSGELFNGHFPLYFTGASGHEPLYHYLNAGLHAVLGYNVLSGHLLAVWCGTLAVPLTFKLTQRLFGFLPATLAALALSTSFWSLMYSRFALRQISLPLLTLAAFYLLWRLLSDRPPARSAIRPAFLAGLALGASLYTYPASRVLPALVAIMALYLVLFHRDVFRRTWRALALALIVVLVLALPLASAIAHGASEAAAQGIGADARLVELARPIRALRDGDPDPLLENIWLTLGMFHATGDPEALYNIPDRPVFNLVDGALFWAGVLICMWRWRTPRYFFLLLWLGAGLSPTVLSVPPASLSHSILIQPLAYLLPALALTEGYRWLQTRFKLTTQAPLWVAAALVFLLPTAYRDLRDYFVRWPRLSYVRFLYRADYRDAARYLDEQSESRDWAVGSLLMGPWDRLALDVDVQRDDLTLRLFNPQRALLYPTGLEPGAVLLPSYPPPAPSIERLLRQDNPTDPGHPRPTLTTYRLATRAEWQNAPLAQFDNGLDLVAVVWEALPPPEPGQEMTLLTYWMVAAPLQLPPMPLVANPPPPGIYAGPRLAVFAHLLAADGTLVAGDDGLWVDPLTLRPGDRFIQIHHFAWPAQPLPGSYTVEMGLYDPFNGERWLARSETDLTGSDHIVFPVPE